MNAEALLQELKQLQNKKMKNVEYAASNAIGEAIEIVKKSKADIGQCHTCKHWNGKPEDKFASCGSQKLLYGDGRFADDYQEDMLLYRQYEGSDADCWVGRGFGCVHFKSKNT